MLRTRSKTFFFKNTATTEIYTLSLHDALPICETAWWCVISELVWIKRPRPAAAMLLECLIRQTLEHRWLDRKSTRLNSSHQIISYAVFCLKKKKTQLNLFSPHICTTSTRHSSS